MQTRNPVPTASSIRAGFKSAKTIVVKVGSTVVSRPDGSCALGRIGSVVEQLSQLRREGKRVVLVASGAVSIGTTRLNEQAVLSRSIRTHLQGSSPPAVSARARAAAGQGGLMGLYDTLFTQNSLACGQVLVTEEDFQTDKRKAAFTNSLNWLLDNGAVPVINENDVLAVPSARQLFKDNDSLAVLIALALRADLLLLLSDVHGVYARKPAPGEEPELLPLFTRRTMQTVSFGEKSAVGRGGMEAKVEAALRAAETGVGAVVIGSGCAADSSPTCPIRQLSSPHPPHMAGSRRTRCFGSSVGRIWALSSSRRPRTPTRLSRSRRRRRRAPRGRRRARSPRSRTTSARRSCAPSPTPSRPVSAQSARRTERMWPRRRRRR